ncbi:MAG: hypothetical protein V4620_04265 [Bacteroidota bacterium]
MQKDNFNDILQERAKEFTVKPLYTNFESIVIEQQKKQFKIKTRILVGLLLLLISVVIALKLQFTQTNIPQEEELTSSNKETAIPNQSTTQQAHSSSTNTPSASKIIVPKSEKLNTEKIVVSTNKPLVVNKPNPVNNKSNSTPAAMVNNIENKEKPNTSSSTPKLANTVAINNNLNPITETAAIATQEPVSDTSENIINTLDKKDTVVANANKAQATTPSDSLHNIYKNKKQKSNYSFSIAAFNRYMLVNNAYNGANNSVIKDEYGIDFSEKAKSSMSTGMSFYINKNNFSLGVGLAYTTIQFNKIYNASDIYNNKSADSILTNELATKSPAGYKRNIIDQNLRYIEIPVSLSYKFGNKAFHFSSQVGASFQWLLSTETYLFETNNKQIDFKTIDDAKDQRFQHFQITYFTSVHANYQISKWSFFAGPIIKLHQNQLYNNDFIKRTPPLFIGIESGIKFNF